MNVQERTDATGKSETRVMTGLAGAAVEAGLFNDTGLQAIIGATTPKNGTFAELAATLLASGTLKKVDLEATAAGAAIPDGTLFVSVTNETDANDIAILPAPTPGSLLFIHSAEGFELRSSAPGTVGINGGTGATVESAIPAGVLSILFCLTATAWVGFEVDAVGAVTAVEVAA